MLPDTRADPPICALAEGVLHAGPMSSPGPDMPLDLLGLPLDRLTRFLQEELGERPFHARQLYRWIHQRGVTDFEQMTDLSKSLRTRLRERCALEPLAKDLEQRSSDGTIKYRWRTRDGRLIESVYMPSTDRKTLCVSTQVGCAMACKFCMTGTLGLLRNLTAAEIVAQVHVVNREVARNESLALTRPLTNLVFMGMGEPFLNYDEFIRSVEILVKHVGIPESRMTVSTSGIEPAIRKFAHEPLRPKLALSLNASNDVVREQVMPITRKWKIGQLLDAVKTLPLGKREWVTFEYVLLGGVNDQPEHAREVVELLSGMRAKVNLIVWNPGPGINYTQPKPEDVAVFQKMLIEGGMPAYIRRPRGRDIYAACGQLKRTVSEEPGQLVTIG